MESEEPASKTVLVCFEQWKRPVTFNGGVQVLTEAMKTAFQDVLPADDNSPLVLQVKNEDWGGEFVDVIRDDDISDRSVVRTVFSSSARPDCKVGL